MGYSTTPKMVEQNRELLDKIKAAINAGKEISLVVRPNSNISTEQYRLRRLLAATDHHKGVCNGEYVGLGSRTSLSIDAEKDRIIARPKGGVQVEEYRATELDALQFLSSASGSLTTSRFFPTPRFSKEQFIVSARALGWEVHPAAFSDEADGSISFGAEKAIAGDEKSGFSIFDEG